jgi:uridine kinase
VRPRRVALHEVELAVRRAQDDRLPLLVAIDGAGGSGKSTVATELLARDVLEPARRGQPVAYQRFDWEQNALGPLRSIATPRIVIIEGITSLHPALDHYWNVRIWVDADPEIARERGRARDAGNENEPLWDLWSRNDARYRAEHRPHRRADVIVEN